MKMLLCSLFMWCGLQYYMESSWYQSQKIVFHRCELMEFIQKHLEKLWNWRTPHNSRLFSADTFIDFRFLIHKICLKAKNLRIKAVNQSKASKCKPSQPTHLWFYQIETLRNNPDIPWMLGIMIYQWCTLGQDSIFCLS